MEQLYYAGPYGKVGMASSLTTLWLKLIYRYYSGQHIDVGAIQPSEENTKEIKAKCHAMETTVMQIFINYGWRFGNRLE
jgi:hypothetical protein